MGIVVYSLLWIMQDLYHQPLLCACFCPATQFEPSWQLAGADLQSDEGSMGVSENRGTLI